MLVRVAKYGDENSYWLFCPGCNDTHRITDAWNFNNDFRYPTFAPSILVTGTGNVKRCHSFVTNGEWQFLTDSEHVLAGLTVPMVDLPTWLVSDE